MSRSSARTGLRVSPAKFALAYAAFGAFWMVVSDLGIEWLLGDRATPGVQTTKGLVFIAATTALVYWLARWADRERTAARRHRSAQQAHAERFRAVVEEEKLRRSRLLTVIEHLAEAVVVTDAEGTIEYVNPAFEQQTGYSRKEALGRSPRILKSGHQGDDFYAEMWRTLTRGRTWSGRMVNRRKDGTLFTEEASISPVHDEAGRTVNYVAIKRDITRQLDLESQLLQAQKMESIGRLAGGVAHDFNNMLGVITGYAELALEATEPGTRFHEWVGQIHEAAERSAALTNQLLAFARKQPATPEVLDLNTEMAYMLTMLRRLISEEIDLRWEPGQEIGLVEIDPVQLGQILANLVINARDAIVARGTISIETYATELDAADCALRPGSVPGRYVVLAVSDDGEGMDRETAAKVFEPFFTTKPGERGTGLGLAVVHGMVRQNDGFIHVYSEPGHGTTFRIYLPRSEQREAVALDEPKPRVVRTGRETVLVVEDEEALLALVTTFLERLGHTALAAETPSRALDVVREHPGRIDLLLTDVVLPEMSGPDLWRELRKSCPGLKCLFMSGYTNGVVARRGASGEGVRFLPKPFTAESLSDALRNILDD